MTLYRQLATSIIILFAVGFIGIVLSSTSNLRSFLESQLETHAQDTATSLGLSLSPHMQKPDLPVINSMIDAIFDRGYFQSIQLIDIDGNTLVEKTRENQGKQAPGWFIKLVSFQSPSAESILMSGWKQAGSIHVESHPGFAYREMWSNTRDTFLLFLAAAIIILGAALLALKLLLHPLREVEKQAEAIGRRSWIVQKRLPRTRELRSVVTAMNRLSSRVSEIFTEQSELTEELRRKVYLDTVTEVGNRQSFNRQCQIQIEAGEHEAHGALLLVRLGALKEINESEGYPEGDKLLQRVAGLLKAQINKGGDGFVARLSGGEFGLVLPGADTQDAEKLATNLCEELRLVQDEVVPGSHDFAHVGLTMWEHGRDHAGLLAEADHALRSASIGAAVDWHRYQTEANDKTSAVGKEYWRSRVRNAVDTGNFRLCTQAVYTADNERNVLHREVLLRLPDGEGNYTSAGIYHPAIDFMNGARKLDRLIVEKLLEHVAGDDSQIPYAINLSMASITDQDFREWLCKTLEASERAAGRIQLEMAENTVTSNIEQTGDLVNHLASCGYQTGIDHFGRDFHPFGYLSTLGVNYIKVDGYYTRGISRNSANQFFIKSLREMVHTLGIKIMAQSVETGDEYESLRTIRLDGYQGYLFGKPEPLQLRT
jgi:diguanylate cyclase (GGDEF)-like protein